MSTLTAGPGSQHDDGEQLDNLGESLFVFAEHVKFYILTMGLLKRQRQPFQSYDLGEGATGPTHYGVCSIAQQFFEV